MPADSTPTITTPSQSHAVVEDQAHEWPSLTRSLSDTAPSVKLRQASLSPAAAQRDRARSKPGPDHRSATVTRESASLRRCEVRSSLRLWRRQARRPGGRRSLPRIGRRPRHPPCGAPVYAGAPVAPARAGDNGGPAAQGIGVSGGSASGRRVTR